MSNKLASDKPKYSLKQGVFRSYKKLSAILFWSSQLIFPVQCKFQPTCSEYMHDALRKYGAVRGFFTGMRRILRCNPWHDGGADPVVDFSNAQSAEAEGS